MAGFNDLAIELQTAIWRLVLPYRGVHWVEIEGILHDASYVRDSIRFTREAHPDGELPEGYIQELRSLPISKGQLARMMAAWEADRHSTRIGLFFQSLIPVVPSVWGAAGPGDEDGDGELPEQLAEDIAHTRRCRQLSTYTQVSALLQTCWLSRHIALEYVREYYPWLAFIYRSRGLVYRPRPLDVWEAHYQDENSNGPHDGLPHTALVPVVRSVLDLVVLRLHDSHGRATPMLRQGPFQFNPQSRGSVFTWFHRVAIEWNPRWADERDEFRPPNVQSIFSLMDPDSMRSTMLYWLVDGVPRPNWKRDYPRLVPAVFEAWTRHHMWRVYKYDNNMDKATKDALLADCNLNLEFEANGRRYYVVFVVIAWDLWATLPEEVKSKITGPFLGGEDIWPEKLRAPARLAYDMLIAPDSFNVRDLYSLCTCRHMSFILSWEPI